MNRILTVSLVIIGTAACSPGTSTRAVRPVYITDSVRYDSDDPAIWYNASSPENSLILGTDKKELDGGVYVFNLKGKVDTARTIRGIDRPNNVDIAYGFKMDSTQTDIAVFTERGKGQIRVVSLPDMQSLDGGGIPVFEDDTAYNDVMGVSLYTRPTDRSIFAIVSRKECGAAKDTYLYQYLLQWDSTRIIGKLVRKFGRFSGNKEIEAIAVDNEYGYVYYSDEDFGIHKYYANPEAGDEELAVFGQSGFAIDREGISIYKKLDGTGYILVSDQGANRFHVFPREGTSSNPHQHDLLFTIPVTSISSDGSESISLPLSPEFPEGLFIAMSDNRTFEIFSWADLLPKK